MSLRFPCPACGRLLEAPETAAGLIGSCKFCNVLILAPTYPGGPAILAASVAPPAAASATASAAPPPAGYGMPPGAYPGGPLPPPYGYVVVRPANMPLILTMWGFTLCSMIVMAFGGLFGLILGILAEMVSFTICIVLILSRSRTDNINGWVKLGLVALGVLMGYFTDLSALFHLLR